MQENMVEQQPQTPRNPLEKYFRQPAIYVKLPSGGQGYAPGVIDMPANGELPIYPMTALDEITSRTPDALFNGSAVVNIFRSCVPNIKDPWQIISTDLDMLLTAVKIASYGHDMEVTSKCPKCSEDSDLVQDLRTVIDQYKTPDYMTPLAIGDMEIYFKPLTYKEINEASQRSFQQQKAMQMQQSQETNQDPDVKQITELSEALRSITEVTVTSMANSIHTIKIADDMVTDAQHIKEFLVNADRKVFEAIKDRLAQIKSASELKPMKVKCTSEKCGHEYEQPFTLDMSNFFV